jgi:hypothetical protein
VLSYGGTPVTVELKEGADRIDIGRVIFAPAGFQLFKLVSAPVVPGFLEYVAETWRADGHKVTAEAASDTVPKTSGAESSA